MRKPYIHAELRNQLFILPTCSLRVSRRTKGREPGGAGREKGVLKAPQLFPSDPAAQLRRPPRDVGSQLQRQLLRGRVECPWFLMAQMLPKFQILKRFQGRF